MNTRRDFAHTQHAGVRVDVARQQDRQPVIETETDIDLDELGHQRGAHVRIQMRDINPCFQCTIDLRAKLDLGRRHVEPRAQRETIARKVALLVDEARCRRSRR